MYYQQKLLAAPLFDNLFLPEPIHSLSEELSRHAITEAIC